MTFTGNLDNFLLFERIARERCEIDTLRTRGRDCMDFHDVSIWALLDMMQSAYDAGLKADSPAYHAMLEALDAVDALIRKYGIGDSDESEPVVAKITAARAMARRQP